MALPTPDPTSIQWDDLRYLLAALRHGSFTAAARHLGTDQSTVSRRIAALEASLGVILFERGARAPVATEAAVNLRDGAERVEAEMARFADDVVGIRHPAVSGRVRLAATEEIAVHVIVPRVLPALRTRYPGLHVDLLTGYGAADLVAREADVAIRFFQTERGELVGRRIAQLPTAILGARAQARRLRRRAVTELDWIAVELAGLATPESTWLAAHVGRPPVMVCSSYQVQLAAIRAGVGVGIGPRAFTTLDRAFVALDPPGADLPALDLFVVTRRAIRTLPRIAAVIDAITDGVVALGAEA
ncbi:MAG: LysR family transcriptional regulator [Deltaproteobacteria bacterium]|nr:LysR family transcriptional regulator [Deltaproteobacteria bacterium]